MVQLVAFSVSCEAAFSTLHRGRGCCKQVPDVDSLQCTGPFQGMPLDFKDRQSTCRSITHQFYLSRQVKLMILLAHAQLVKVFEKPCQHFADASESASGSEATGLYRTNVFGGASSEDVRLIRLCVDKGSQTLDCEPLSSGREGVEVDQAVANPRAYTLWKALAPT